LNHPALALPIDFGVDGAAAFFVLQASAGGDLGTQRGGSYAYWLPQLQSVAQALCYLHEQGLVHGDVKASNVLIDAAGHARLSDFGNLLQAGTTRTSTSARSTFTTSPQQRDAQAASFADDIYSFGALIYEMLSGQPPGYPDGTLVKLSPVHQAPQPLIDLVEQCLNELPSARPTTMTSVATSLETIVAGPDPIRTTVPLLTPPETASDALQANWKRPVHTETVDYRQIRRQGFRTGALVAVVVIGAIVAIVWLVVPAPKAPVPVSVVVAAKPSPEASAAQQIEDRDLRQLAQRKSEADALRAKAGSRADALVAADVSSWNPTGSVALTTALTDVDANMDRREYESALSQLKALSSTLDGLENGRRVAFDAALKQGQAALGQRNSVAASAAFATALKLDADSSSAKRGARRAATLDEVLAELSRARGLEQEGRLSAAALAYRRALALDAETPDAVAGLARTGAQLAADQFGQTMARGYAALRDRRSAAAREAFEAARKMRPDDPEIPRALAQLASEDSATELKDALSRARTAAIEEHWAESLAQYQKALAIDATLADVRGALNIATERAQLDKTLDQFIGQPERLYAPTVHDAAVNTLQRARAIIPAVPKLSEQITRLNALLVQADTPLSVTLRSDNQTAVTIYRVGELGQFVERTVQLKPGRYVVLGARVGFRDVRQEINLVPGKAEGSIVVQCNEPI
jgi:hypothetical protein